MPGKLPSFAFGLAIEDLLLAGRRLAFRLEAPLNRWIVAVTVLGGAGPLERPRSGHVVPRDLEMPPAASEGAANPSSKHYRIPNSRANPRNALRASVGVHGAIRAIQGRGNSAHGAGSGTSRSRFSVASARLSASFVKALSSHNSIPKRSPIQAASRASMTS